MTSPALNAASKTPSRDTTSADTASHNPTSVGVVSPVFLRFDEPLPLASGQSLFGDVGLSAAVAFFAINSFVMHTVGVRLLPGVATRGGWRSPVLLASVIAVAWRYSGVPVPVWVIDTARMLGAVTVPLMLLSLGHALALIPSGGLRVGAGLGVMRLVLGLLSGLVVVWVLGLDSPLAGSLVLQMAMPCAVVSYMYARRYTDMGDTAAGAVLVSTVLFLLIAPALLWFTGH